MIPEKKKRLLRTALVFMLGVSLIFPNHTTARAAEYPANGIETETGSTENDAVKSVASEREEPGDFVVSNDPPELSVDGYDLDGEDVIYYPYGADSFMLRGNIYSEGVEMPVENNIEYGAYFKAGGSDNFAIDSNGDFTLTPEPDRTSRTGISELKIYAQDMYNTNYDEDENEILHGNTKTDVYTIKYSQRIDSGGDSGNNGSGRGGGSYELKGNTDYTVNGGKYTIKAEYLKSLSAGEHKLVFDMNRAAENGIVSGIGNGLYAPGADLSGQDSAVMLDRYAGLAGISIPAARNYSGFVDDDDIAGYAQEAVERLYNGGVINGKSGNAFDPKGSATRAEAAVLFSKLASAELN